MKDKTSLVLFLIVVLFLVYLAQSGKLERVRGILTSKSGIIVPNATGTELIPGIIPVPNQPPLTGPIGPKI